LDPTWSDCQGWHVTLTQGPARFTSLSPDPCKTAARVKALAVNIRRNRKKGAFRSSELGLSGAPAETQCGKYHEESDKFHEVTGKISRRVQDFQQCQLYYYCIPLLCPEELILAEQMFRLSADVLNPNWQARAY
jgi:hypothetical protein